MLAENKLWLERARDESRRKHKAQCEWVEKHVKTHSKANRGIKTEKTIWKAMKDERKTKRTEDWHSWAHIKKERENHFSFLVFSCNSFHPPSHPSWWGCFKHPSTSTPTLNMEKNGTKRQKNPANKLEHFTYDVSIWIFLPFFRSVECALLKMGKHFSWISQQHPPQQCLTPEHQQSMTRRKMRNFFPSSLA